MQQPIEDDQAAALLEQETRRNQVIEETINRMRQDNPEMDGILGQMINW